MNKKQKQFDLYRIHRNRTIHTVGFKLTFEEWISIWEKALGPNWMKMRGCKRDQYHMSRFKDKGPYAIGNVEIKTNRENAREGATKSSRRYWRRLRKAGYNCGPGVMRLRDL